MEAWITGDASEVEFAVRGSDQADDRALTEKVPVVGGKAEAVFVIENVHLWDGLEDPYLYVAKASLDTGDAVETKFGCRTFSIDPEKGFFLNGRSYPLCGAARHQDRQGVGYAITPEMHREDREIIQEMGRIQTRPAHDERAECSSDIA